MCLRIVCTPRRRCRGAASRAPALNRGATQCRLGSCSLIGRSAGGCRSTSWPDNPLGRWRVDCEQASRADGPPDELASAVRTDPVQDVLRAVAAPGALVRADKHVRGCRVEVPVAAFAIRPQLQHMTSIDSQPRQEQASIPVRPPSRRADPANLCGHRSPTAAMTAAMAGRSTAATDPGPARERAPIMTAPGRKASVLCISLWILSANRLVTCCAAVDERGCGKVDNSLTPGREASAVHNQREVSTVQPVSSGGRCHGRAD